MRIGLRDVVSWVEGGLGWPCTILSEVYATQEPVIVIVVCYLLYYVF